MVIETSGAQGDPSMDFFKTALDAQNENHVKQTVSF